MTKIYTKTGDTGETGLLSGKRVSKDHLRIEAYGTVDELNAFTGLLRDHIIEIDLSVAEILLKIQHQLFVIGSHLANTDEKLIPHLPVLASEETVHLESAIDGMEKALAPLQNFILPGGHILISYAHVCRTICRRAERHIVQLANNGKIHPVIIPYANRLSDYFFTLARFLAHTLSIPETTWHPSPKT